MFYSMMGLIPYLIVLIVIGLIIYGVVAWRRREPGPIEVDPGIGTVRRLYFYTVSFVSLMMATNGVVLLLWFVFRGIFQGVSVSSSNAVLAGGVSLIVVGLPLWLFHWRLIQRYVGEMPVETRSVLRKFYMYLVLAVGSVHIVVLSVLVLLWIFGMDTVNAYVWSALVIWVPVWAFHWLIEQGEGQSTSDTLGVRRLYVYVASLLTLIMLASGTGMIAFFIIQDGYEALTSASIAISGDRGIWSSGFKTSLAVAIVGGLVWPMHWFYIARNDVGSALRQVYLYIFAVLGGVVTVLTALGIILNGFLVWLLGAADSTAASHFDFLPGAIASIAVGVGLWAYHWMVVQKEAEVSPKETLDARRAYVYLMSGIGLAALAIGIVLLVGTTLELIGDSLSQVIGGKTGLRRETLATSITLLAIGGPLWGSYWRSAQRLVGEGTSAEAYALPRRIFVFAALGIGVLSLLGSVSTALFMFLNDLLAGRISAGTFDDLIVPISIIVSAIIFVPYYWSVYKQDRQGEPDAEQAPVVRKEVTVLVAAGGEDLVSRLQAALGYRVSGAQWADADAGAASLSDEECRQLASRVADAPGSRVMVIPDGSGVRVVSYR